MSNIVYMARQNPDVKRRCLSYRDERLKWSQFLDQATKTENIVKDDESCVCNIKLLYDNIIRPLCQE